MKGGGDLVRNQVAEGQRLRPDLAVTRFMARTRFLGTQEANGGAAATSPPRDASRVAAPSPEPVNDWVTEITARAEKTVDELMDLICG